MSLNNALVIGIILVILLVGDIFVVKHLMNKQREEAVAR